MENLEKISKIKREALSGEHYFQSLLKEAFTAQQLSEPELEKIQLDCLTLLAKKTEQFSGGESSSIRIEKAQDLFASVLFTIGVALKMYPCPDAAAAALQSMGVDALYAQGRKQIDSLLKRAKMHHRLLVSHLLQTKNAFYFATIVDGINGFFKHYNADFGAQEIHITADYPVYNKTERLLGIEFILQYLKQLSCENSFCMHFPHEDIHHLLCGYEEGYENLLLNLYEPVLAAALGTVLAGGSANLFEITPEIQSFLDRLFAGKTRTQLEQMLGGALLKLAESLSLSDSLIAYVQQSLPQLAVTIEGAMKTGSLDRVFLAAKYPGENPTLTISYGEKMDDAAYCKVLELFMSCESMPEKISILKNQIHSLGDVEDLLLDAELSADEITTILKSLSPAEIVTLLKKYSAAYEMSFTELRDCEKILCEGLFKFAASLPPEQQTLLATAVKALAVEEYEQW